MVIPRDITIQSDSSEAVIFCTQNQSEELFNPVLADRQNALVSLSANWGRGHEAGTGSKFSPLDRTSKMAAAGRSLRHPQA